MRGSQLKLMAAVSALVLVVVAAAGWVADRNLRARELDRLVDSMQREAALVQELAAGLPLAPAASPRLDAVADRAGQAAGARVTLIAPDGTVVGDSAVPLERLAQVENHGDRLEVRAALAGAAAFSERRSETVGRPFLYVAVPVAGGRNGVVRIAADLGRVEAVRAELRSRLIPAAGVALLATIALSWGYAHLSLRRIRELERLTAAVAGGDLDARVPRHFSDETAGIARSIQRLAEQLRERLAQTTAEKERLQAVLDGMAEAVLVVDPEGHIALANGRLQEFFGVPQDIVGRTALEGIRNADLAELMASTQRDGEPEARTLSISHPAPRTLRVHAVAFPGPPAAPLGTVAVFHDVTELVQLGKMRRDFVANASHELRTPLAAIRGFAETLLGSPELADEDRRSYLEVIDRHARRLGTLVGDLLELSRVERGQGELELGRVDVAEVAESHLRDIRVRFEEKRIRVSTEVKGDPVAWAETAALEQIFGNLLDNALKYTEPGGKVELRISGDGPRVEVSVTDTGIGIPDSDLGRIFERFYRVDKARSRTLGGTGLGLAIVKHVVQSLGGEIAVESALGRGSTFSFDLPRPERGA